MGLPGTFVTPEYLYEGRQSTSLPWLKDRTIFLGRHGSHAYGLNTPESDLDIRGVAVAPGEYYFGVHKTFEQAQGKLEDGSNIEYSVTELRKFLRLAGECSPNVIEVLFLDKSDWVYDDGYNTWSQLYDNRHLFLSKLAKHRFSGYAHGQLKKIKAHKRWLDNPPKEQPTRADFKLPERSLLEKEQVMAAFAAVQKQLDRWQFKELEAVDPGTRIALMGAMAEALAEMSLSEEDIWRRSAAFIGFDSNMIDLLEHERKYYSAQREWKNYQTWLKERNPKRAELEKKAGYDTKHASHLVRLIRMCEEILVEGEVHVKRTHDRQEIIDIKQGAWSYEKLLEWTANKDEELAGCYAKSKLPNSPDWDKIDELCADVLTDAL